MNRILFIQKHYSPKKLYPFSLTVKVQDMLTGMRSIRKKWELALQAISFDEEDKPLFGEAKTYIIPCNLLPDKALVEAIKKLKPGEAIFNNYKELLAALIISNNGIYDTSHCFNIHTITSYKLIEFPWHLFTFNKESLLFDIDIIANINNIKNINTNENRFIAPENVYIDDTADVKHCNINAALGPVYIDKHAVVMEGSCLRGPLYIGEHAVVKMGARIYGSTSVGKECTVGGEIKNSILFSYSNKAHDGYMGDSVIGNWCNWGAGTSNSNLKNTGNNIDVHLQEGIYKAGQKCGIFMGDYSRTAVNTMLNSGTTIGVAANVFGKGLSPKKIPSFAWGFDNATDYLFEKALIHINNWKLLKHQTLTEKEKKIITDIYKQTKSRNNEKADSSS